MASTQAATKTESRAVELDIGGKKRLFDIDNPELPKWIDEAAFSSDDYPYKKKLDDDEYLKTLEKLQIELVKLQLWQQATGKRIIALFEGRDAAGKGGAIHATSGNLNPRWARVVALTKPTETERGQWYFQRYIATMPTSGELVLLRPLLVQPRRRRAGHGLLHARAARAIPEAGAAL